MSYESKTCTEVINDQRFYFLWTSDGFQVFHWSTELASLGKISEKFFINIENARAYASRLSVRELLQAHLAWLQAKLEGGVAR